MRYYFAIFLCLLSPLSFAQQELLHWWSTKGELKALQTIERLVKQENNHTNNQQWQVNSITGAGGLITAKVLQTRGLAGKLPTLAQLSGTEITTWANFGLLESLDDTALQENWNKVMRPLTLSVSQYQGQFIALPLAIHRINWLWTNKTMFDKHQLLVPENVEQLIAVIKQFKKKNIKPLAIGNQPWQVAILFENIALGLTGSKYYQKAFMELDNQAINSPEMQGLLDKFREISLLIKPSISADSWESATLSLVNGQAAMQLGGDWILGELMAIDKHVLTAINCHAAPGTEGEFIYNMDHFVHFKNDNSVKENISAGRILKQLSSKRLQHDFNKAKGALPARLDVDISDFNRCSLQAQKVFQSAKNNRTLLPSMTDSMAVNPIVQKMMISLIYDFFNNTQVSNQQFIDNFLAISLVEVKSK